MEVQGSCFQHPNADLPFQWCQCRTSLVLYLPFYPSLASFRKCGPEDHWPFCPGRNPLQLEISMVTHPGSLHPALSGTATWLDAHDPTGLSVFYVLHGVLTPPQSILLIACNAMILAFFSASQDTVLDAYRRELLPDPELGLGNAMYVNGYRTMAFIPGGLGLILADHLPWSQVHFIIGSFMLIGIIKTLAIKELNKATHPPRSLKESVVEPLREFFTRKGFASGLLVVAFLFFYKLGDNMATALSTPFYLDVGFSKTVIGSTVKLVNFWSMILGSFIGGLAIYRYGINKCLWLFGVVQMISIFGFAILNESGPVLWILTLVIAFEYLGVGLGASALLAFMARATNMNFTATQFALFSSLIALPRTFANSICGFIIEGIGPKDGFLYESFGFVAGLGYTRFFIFCGFMALPGMLLLFWVAPWKEDLQHRNGPATICQ